MSGLKKLESSRIKSAVGALNLANRLWVDFQLSELYLVEKILIPIKGLYGI